MNVVFDFGAVLFTWRPVDLITECFPARAGTPAQAGHLAHEVFGHADWQAFDAGLMAMDVVVARTAARLDLDAQVLGDLVGSIDDRLEPMAPSVALLEQLHGLPDVHLYFLSNMPEPYARALEQRHSFLDRFNGGIFSGDVGLAKPDPAIYQLLQTRHALVPAQTVFIDDLLGNIEAAQTQGWHGIHFKSAAQVTQALQALGVAV
ncbi:HAD family hydrolase [Rhodoferax saidenbachensis]|uniref:Haloacid dehalogenase n=1 Tax=Rhodoferax saidenbachensis TaxID=1484693 RepID=A0A1P8K719_9BURK|nr:HAD family phosphatase [Rhodoferax saidenbachensis]APW41808.1 haloacid dehalogenase [Rhodoferax saidenbachensis]